MNFLEKLDYLMKRDGLNKSTLSNKSGIPYTTIDAFYKKGYGNIKLSTLEKLCECFNTSLDYLVNDKISDPYYGVSEEMLFSEEDIEFLHAFQNLNSDGRKMAKGFLKLLNDNPDYQKNVPIAKAT